MPYTRPPTRLQQLCEVPRFAVKNILSDLILGPVISLGAEWLHTQAAVFKKTPQEYSDEAWKSMKYNMKPVRLVRGLYADAVLEPERVRRNRRLAWVYNRRTKWKWQEETWSHRVVLDEPPAPGTIRVKWLRELEPLEGEHGLYQDVPLTANGELDLGILKRKWGMENCFAVDPKRLTVFYPSEQDKLSAMAVRLLMDDQGYLRVIEQPSEKIKSARETRETLRALPTQMKEEAEDWIGGILSVFLQWLWMLLLLGSIFWLVSSTWNTDAAISGRRMVMYVVERDILLRKMVWMGRGIWIRLPNITSWQTTGVLGEVGSTLLIMMDGR